MINDLPEHMIYSITTSDCASTHPGNDSPLASFEVVRNGLPEIVNTWRGSHFIRCADPLESLTETKDHRTPAVPLMVITKQEYDIMISMLGSVDEDGNITERTLPMDTADIVALVGSWRADTNADG